MTFWEFFGIAVIPAIITAVLGAIVSFVCVGKQNKMEIQKIETEYKKQLESHKKQLV